MILSNNTYFELLYFATGWFDKVTYVSIDCLHRDDYECRRLALHASLECFQIYHHRLDFTRNLNMLLILKFTRLIMNHHQFFEKNTFFTKMQQKSKKYLTCIFIKVHSSYRKFITKMISAKNSTSPVSFNGFGRGRRINLARSHVYTLAEGIFDVHSSQNQAWRKN